jgi:hypothetical protein
MSELPPQPELERPLETPLAEVQRMHEEILMLALAMHRAVQASAELLAKSLRWGPEDVRRG